MKHQVTQSQFKKWLIIGGISWFLFSVAIPTRYLLNGGQFLAIISFLAIPLIYSAFQVFYIMKNQELQTYADILNFINPDKKAKISVSSEFWFAFSLIVAIWGIFFVGTIVSALLFW